MTSEVVTVRPETSLRDVAGILAECRISRAPVIVDDGEVVGLVSEGDILFKERGPSESKGILARLSDPHRRDGQLKLEARSAGDAIPGVVALDSSLRRLEDDGRSW